MTELLTTLNSLSPLGVIALGLFVIYTLVRQHKTLTSNHLHELPEMHRKLGQIVESNVRQEIVLARILETLNVRRGR